jgi:RNA 3'-terminal phosphate cyclase (ATP)
VVFEGGTHNEQAPTFDFLDEAYLPLVRRMGARAEASLERYGFYPAGGGAFRLHVGPSRLAPIELVEAGALRSIRAEALFANLPHHVAARELAVVRDALDLPPDRLETRQVKSHGPGNVLSLVIERDTTERVVAFGRRGVRAEAVAEAAVAEAKALVAAEVPVGPHLADQLLLPLALAGGGALRTLEPTMHARTNAAVIERFLGVATRFEAERPGVARVRVG